MIRQAHITVTGVEALDFLQGQLTNDLRDLASGDPIRSAWCNPKGRVICLFRVLKDDGAYVLTLPAELAEDVVKRLTMYRFRAKVDFETRLSGETLDPAEFIRAGIPVIGRAQTEKFTSHMLNLDLLDAISFDKGCYTGQEVIARTHYKGATRRRTLRFASEQPVSVGDKLSDGERDVGEVLNVAGTELLAVVPIEKADDALAVKGHKLTRLPMPYAVQKG